MEAHPRRSLEWTLLIHGGAGVMRRAEMTPEMDAAYRAGAQRCAGRGLEGAGGVAGAFAGCRSRRRVRVLEDNPNFNAGKGAVLTREGVAELDASIMDGTRSQGRRGWRRCGP